MGKDGCSVESEARNNRRAGISVTFTSSVHPSLANAAHSAAVEIAANPATLINHINTATRVLKSTGQIPASATVTPPLATQLTAEAPEIVAIPQIPELQAPASSSSSSSTTLIIIIAVCGGAVVLVSLGGLMYYFMGVGAPNQGLNQEASPNAKAAVNAKAAQQQEQPQQQQQQHQQQQQIELGVIDKTRHVCCSAQA